MSFSSLEHYYRVLFTMSQFHNFSISEIENFMPYERDIYAEMIQQKIEEQRKYVR